MIPEELIASLQNSKSLMTLEDRTKLDNLAVWAKMVTRQVEDLNSRLARIEAFNSLTPPTPLQLEPPVERFYYAVPYEQMEDACRQYRLALWGVSGPEAAGRLAALDAKFPLIVDHFTTTEKPETPTP